MNIPRLVAHAFGSERASRQPSGACVHAMDCNQQLLPLRGSMLSGWRMSEQIADRIERALQRIETAARATAFATARLERRNALLRGRIESAIVDLDALIAREAEGAAPEAAADIDAEDAD